MEALKAAVSAGADAVYLGGAAFGARAYAKNLDEQEILSAIDYVHLRNRKLYLTVNTLLIEEELEEKLYPYLRPYYEQGLDAVIVQDMGVLKAVRSWFPDLDIHASTQMTVTGSAGARFLESLGATRVVPARELSFAEIQKIHRTTNLEIECFVHGALCYCYSGQCLFSSLIGGRSGNRGRCAQPCRLPYEAYDKDNHRMGEPGDRYPLSPKDMCTVELLPEIVKSGIMSLKIEGRMKKPEYTAGVVSLYRKYLDLYEKKPSRFHVLPEDMKKLYELYNRDGFNKSYYTVRNGRDMMALKTEKEQENKKKQRRTTFGSALFWSGIRASNSPPTAWEGERPIRYNAKNGENTGLLQVYGKFIATGFSPDWRPKGQCRGGCKCSGWWRCRRGRESA